MKEREDLKLLKRILLIMWMIVIFYFSSQDATKSSATSNGLLLFLFGDLANIPIYRMLIRKLAHAFEFFLLTILLMINVKDYKLSFLYCFLYALSDEFHQYFIPARAMAFKDVCIDMIGSLIAILIMVLIKYARDIAKRKST